uniref:Transmembrane domain-containing protein n=1 Tax=Spironucleus salmonicida TaxID=348837 RepID=V6LEU6_9EUKA|eukprot:EST42196.1 Transmembrane domain-containing protein [Spironucleus salmonicida]
MIANGLCIVQIILQQQCCELQVYSQQCSGNVQILYDTITKFKLHIKQNSIYNQYSYILSLNSTINCQYQVISNSRKMINFSQKLIVFFGIDLFLQFILRKQNMYNQQYNYNYINQQHLRINLCYLYHIVIFYMIVRSQVLIPLVSSITYRMNLHLIIQKRSIISQFVL